MRTFRLLAFQASLLLAALQCAAAYVPNMPVTHARSGLVRLREPFAAPDPAPVMDNALIVENNIAELPLWMRCLAESAGTSFLVLGFSLISSLGLGLAASSMAIGLVIAMAVSALASVSGAHFNPAVTLTIILSVSNRAPSQESEQQDKALASLRHSVPQLGAYLDPEGHYNPA